METKTTINETILALNSLQEKVIGLFKPYAYDITYLVLRNDDGFLLAVNLGSLGGLSETYISSSKGIYKEFSEGRTLADMKKNPFALDEFCKSFNKKQSIGA